MRPLAARLWLSDFLSAFVLGLVGRLHHAAGGLPAVTGGLPELRHDDAEHCADDKKERFYHVIAVLGDRRISWPLIILKKRHGRNGRTRRLAASLPGRVGRHVKQPSASDPFPEGWRRSAAGPPRDVN
ncbi:MAG: hypothetical protein H6644_10625 [Caldilineaceae bacterium]|nr:hypothetical protein [Caldilineaceae bacterium]